MAVSSPSLSVRLRVRKETWGDTPNPRPMPIRPELVCWMVPSAAAGVDRPESCCPAPDKAEVLASQRPLSLPTANPSMSPPAGEGDAPPSMGCGTENDAKGVPREPGPCAANERERRRWTPSAAPTAAAAVAAAESGDTGSTAEAEAEDKPATPARGRGRGGVDDSRAPRDLERTGL
jgi:hypothetical protein